MHLNFKTIGPVAMTEELSSFATLKIRKLEKFLNRTDGAMADVELEMMKGHTGGDIFRAEINLTYPGGFVRAESSKNTMHHAIEVAVSDAGRKLKGELGKKRVLSRKGGGILKKMLRKFSKS